VAVLLWGCATIPSPGAPPEPGVFVLVGVNPFAAAQPTARGRRLHTLEGWRGELYLGYGDYGENTGPIEVSAYDPRTGTFASKLRFPTEAIEVYRPIGDRLYAPAIDPLGGGQTASVAIGEPDGRWWNNARVLMSHAFDLATVDGTDLWLVGSLGARAVVMRSLDGGDTWEPSLALARASARPDDFARFYFVFAHRGRLYVQGEDFFGGHHPGAQVFDGAGWTDGPDLRPARGWGGRPLAFGDRIVYVGREGLTVFDGTSVQGTGLGARDLCVADGVLYVLTEGVVRRTRDLQRWETVAVAPANATSLGVLDGILYVGTADSQLYRLSRGPRPPSSRSDLGAGYGAFAGWSSTQG